MTSKHWLAWKAQEPSDDFAERTVAAMLRERRPKRSVHTVRWIAAGAAVAFFVGGVAWGFVAWSAKRVAPRELDVPAAAPNLIAPLRPVLPPPLVSDAPDAQARLPEHVERPIPRRMEPRAPLGGPDAGRPVIRPRCECATHQVICSCY
jgi:hypothetical protein